MASTPKRSLQVPRDNRIRESRWLCCSSQATPCESSKASLPNHETTCESKDCQVLLPRFQRRRKVKQEFPKSHLSWPRGDLRRVPRFSHDHTLNFIRDGEFG